MTPDEYKAALKATLVPKGPFKTRKEQLEDPNFEYKTFDYRDQNRTNWRKKHERK